MHYIDSVMHMFEESTGKHYKQLKKLQIFTFGIHNVIEYKLKTLYKTHLKCTNF